MRPSTYVVISVSDEQVVVAAVKLVTLAALI